MKNLKVNKMVLTAVFVAMAVACSPLSIPVGASKCFPVQHLVNVIAAVFLGPWYALCAAFLTSLIRNIMGTGSLLAFPGSMCGAFLAGVMYRKFKQNWCAYIGEVFGTGVIGAVLAYPIASLVMHKSVAIFAYVIPFIISSVGGTIIAIFVVSAIKKSKVLDKFNINAEIESTK